MSAVEDLFRPILTALFRPSVPREPAQAPPPPPLFPRPEDEAEFGDPEGLLEEKRKKLRQGPSQLLSQYTPPPMISAP